MIFLCKRRPGALAILSRQNNLQERPFYISLYTQGFVAFILDLRWGSFQQNFVHFNKLFFFYCFVLINNIFGWFIIYCYFLQPINLILHSCICLGKTRTKEKYRVVYTDHQRLELEKEFHFNRYITIRRKSELAVNLGLSERQVQPGIQTQANIYIAYKPLRLL